MINKKVGSLIVLTLLITQLGLTEVNAKSENISSKLKKMAKKFSDSYTAKPGAVVPGTLAVFPFQADEKLTKRKVDFAVGEMFTRQLIETESFRIVERVALNKILEEQRLSLTGVIETDSAVAIGKLLGAELLVMGSIAHMGKTYQINTRMVDAETGEVISTDFIEVNVKVFEEEAQSYIALVPDKQAIGLQVVFCLSPFAVTSGPVRNFTGDTGDPSIAYTAETMPQTSGDGLNLTGLGARYFPVKWLAFEGAYFQPAKQEIKLTTEYTGFTADDIHLLQLNLSVRVSRIGCTYTRRFGNNFRGYAGLQMLVVAIDFDEANEDQSLGNRDDTPMALDLGDKSTLVLPMARVGVEWRPQTRIGLSVFGNIGFSKLKDEKTATIIQGNDINDLYNPKTTEIDFITVELPVFYLEAAFAFYF